MTLSYFLSWTLSSGVAIAAFKLLFDIIRHRLIRTRVQAAMNASEAADSILSRVVHGTNADYAQVVRIHNGGGMLKPSSPIFMSIIREAKRPDLSDLMKDIQNMSLPNSYRKLVANLLEKRFLIDIVSHVEESTERGIYKLMDAQQAYCSLLHFDTDEVVYLRVTTSKAHFSDEEKVIFRMATSGLKKIYKHS